jgi:hypothetical protein
MSTTQLLYTQWNTDSNGNKISVLIPNEQHKIVNGQILLSQIPDENNKVSITGMTEVRKSQSITSSTQYKVDYTTGVVNFDSSREGNTITVAQYYGRGLIFIDASRIVTDATGTTIIRTLKDLVTENEQAVIDEATRDANEAARLTAEAIRDVSEDTRIGSENTRITAEDTRKSNETTRVNNETARVNAETTRSGNETTRVNNETARVTAETARANAETTRLGNETNRVNVEATRVTAENNRSTAESSRATAEIARLNSESTRVTNEGTRTSNETARGTAETARAASEVTRGTAETARATAETARATAETARQTAETNRATSFTTIKAAYDAAVASQTNVEITAARQDDNSGTIYPDLKSRLNVTELAPVIREHIPSGFVKMGALDYTYMSTNPNTIKFLDEWVAFVNGFKATITAGTIVTLDVPPVKDAREDLVFLELWLDQVTGAPMNRIRTVAGVDFSVNPEGLRKSGTAWASTLAYAQGGNTSPLVYNSSDPWTTAFGATSDIGTLPSAVNDKGLYLTGYGTTASKTTLKTLDGYVYAIPLFRIPRRPSCGYMESGEYDKISPLTLGINQQKIINKDRVAHSGDGSIGLRIDGRTIPNLLGTDGDCEDLSKWNNNGLTIDTSVKLFGNSSFKAVNTQWMYRDILCDQTHKYLLSVYAYVSSYTSGGASLNCHDYGTNSNGTYIAFDMTKLNQWQRKSGIITGKANGGIRIYLPNSGAPVATTNIDGLMLYDLTAIYGAGLEPSDVTLLERQLPYVSGVGSASSVSVKSVGKNLFDMRSPSTLSGSAVSVLSNGYLASTTSVGSWKSFSVSLSVKPNTAYKLSYSFTRTGSSGGGFDVYDGVSGGALTNLSASPVVGSYNNSFTSSNTGKIRITFWLTSATSESNTLTFSNIQLEEGTVATTYEAYQESSLITPAECNDMKSISSTVKDYTDLYARKQVKNVSDFATLDNLSWSTNNSANGYKGTYAPLSSLTNCGVTNASTNFMVIKNNGIGLNISPSAISTSEGVYSANGYLVVSTSNSDTGFTDGYSPSSNDWKAYFYGWKMCHSDGASPYVPSLVAYTPSTWAEWTKDTGVIGDSTGLEWTADGTNFKNGMINATLKSTTKYGVLYNVVSSTLVGNMTMRTWSGNQLVGQSISKTIGNNKLTFTTPSGMTDDKIGFYSINTEPSGNKIKLKDIRVFELPVGSQIESDFNTLTVDQLAAKYLFYGLNPKNWKKVTDGTGLTATLPTASYAGYTPYKMIYQLATPVETDISELIKGRLYANNSYTNFIVDNVMTSVKTPVAQPNLVTNGDFSSTSGWNANTCSIAVSNNELIVSVTTNTASGGVYRTLPTISGNKYYISAEINAKYSNAFKIGLNTLTPTWTPSVPNTWTKTSIVQTANANNMLIVFYHDVISNYIIGDTFKIRNAFSVDLTAIFGAGNEPDQAWCDKYLEFGTNYLVTGDVNTTALVLQRDNRESFYGVTKQFAVVPASKYKTGKYELMYKPADGTVLIPDTTFTVGTQTLIMANNTSVGSLTLADADVGYKKNLDGSITLANSIITGTLTNGSAIVTGISSSNLAKLRIGDKISYASWNETRTILGISFYTNSLTMDLPSTVSSTLSINRKSYNPSLLLSDILVQNDITQLAHQVSLTGFDNKQMLNKEFDILCRGEFTSY